MSSQKGNAERRRGQKYQNSTKYNNSMHDTSKQTKLINSLEMNGLCARCKEIIEWKIKYKKYKPLTAPKKCCKCDLKAVTRAYYTVCVACIDSLRICGKCAQLIDLVLPVSKKSQAEINQEFEQGLLQLKERERRTLLRLASASVKSKDTGEEEADNAQAERSRALKERYIRERGKLGTDVSQSEDEEVANQSGDEENGDVDDAGLTP